MQLNSDQQRQLAKRTFDALMDRYGEEMNFQFEMMKDEDLIDYEVYLDVEDQIAVDKYFDEYTAKYVNVTV